MQRAASMGRREALELMVDLGFDINVVNRTTALHEAAAAGNLDLVQALLRMGADPSIRDTSFDAPPVDWAAHEGQAHVVAYLQPLTPTRTGQD